MKYTIKVPPSKTEQTVVITIPDLPPSVQSTITGTTPLDPVTEPPVVVEPPPDSSPLAGYELVYSNLFETDNDIDPFDHGQKGQSYIDYANPLEGKGSFRSRPANVSNGCRGEVQFGSAQTPIEGAVDYLVKYNYVVKSFCHSLQWHPNTQGGSASPGLWHENGKFVWKNWVKSGANQTHATGVTIPVGKVMRMTIQYKFGSNGYFRHYIDGVLVCSWNGQVGDGSGQYFKLGFNGNFDNKLSEAVKSDIVYDSLRIYKKV